MSLPKNKDLPGSHYPDIYDGKFPLKKLQNFEELETNLMTLVIFITLNIFSTCFEH